MFTFISCFLSPAKSFNRLARIADPFADYAARLTQCASQVLLPNTFGREYIQRLIAEYQRQQSQLADRTFKYYQTIKSPFGRLKSLFPGTKAFSTRRKLATTMDVIERALSELNIVNAALKDLSKIRGVSGGAHSDESIKKQRCFMGKRAKPQSATPSSRWDKNNSNSKKGTYRSLFQFFNLRSPMLRVPSDLRHQPRSQS